MKQTREKLPFEIHLTTDDLSGDEVTRFDEFCLDNGGKCLIIELSKGKITKQPMFSTTIYIENALKSLEFAKELSEKFISNNFTVRRLKIEVPAEHSNLIEKIRSDLSENYFEWHGKIELAKVRNLAEICEKHKVHLSQNSLRDEDGKRFITLREHGTKTDFQKRLEELIKDIETNGGEILKQDSEYCIYDDNTFLDKGWLSE